LKRTYVILGALAVVVLLFSIAGVWFFYSRFKTHRESFEDDFGNWSANADVPEDPNNPGHPVEWYIKRVAKVSRSGNYSLELFIDGRQDDGTVWIEHKIEARKRLQVKVSFWLYNTEESINTRAVVCAYIGVEKPDAEEDFYVLGSADEVAGWRNYAYTVFLENASSVDVWVAVGISVRWETYLTYYIDEVEIEVFEPFL
jgi:hypothetical protein